MITSHKLPFFGFAIVLLAVLFAITPAAEAKGENFDKVVIYGNGVAIESNDSSFLAFEFFNNYTLPYPGTPSVVGEGFLIVRFGQDQQTGEFIAVDSLRFFPTSLSSGSKPFVYYEGLVNGWSEYDRNWYDAKPEAVATIEKMINPEAGPSTLPDLGAPMLLTLSAIVGFACGLIAMALIIQRSMR